MNPIAVIGGSFLLWLAIAGRVQTYAALVHKASQPASVSPSSGNGQGAASSAGAASGPGPINVP